MKLSTPNCFGDLLRKRELFGGWDMEKVKYDVDGLAGEARRVLNFMWPAIAK